MMFILKHATGRVDYFPITVATSLLDDTPQVINLANTIGKKCSGNPYTNKPSAQSKYLLPAKINQNTRGFRKNTMSLPYLSMPHNHRDSILQ
jgi:hypothetical protein